MQLPPGSFVLFERGGVYRGGVKTCAGVTYTAYGKGEKPRVYASPWNGADPGKWEKTDAPDVWRCQIGEQDVGTIVFDGGRTNAVKIVPVCHKNGTFTQQYNGRPFNRGYRDLVDDLCFWHDYSAKSKFQPHAKGTGYLYLCSRENPGRRFGSIEFCVRRHGFGGRNDVTIDNFCIMYVGAHGVGAGTVRNLKVTNCEFGWIGGSIQSESIFGRNWPTRFGNAVEIYGGCDGFTVENCYVHDVYDAGLTPQFNLVLSGGKGGAPTVQRNVRFSRNVIERCNYSIEYFISGVKDPATDLSRMDGFLIERNLMRSSGEGFCFQRPDRAGSAHVKGWRYTGGSSNRNRAEGFVIRDNVFADCRDMFVEISSSITNPDGTDSMPKMEGNVFIGRDGQRFGVLNQGRAVEINYDAAGVECLVRRYGNNVFATRPPR